MSFKVSTGLTSAFWAADFVQAEVPVRRKVSRQCTSLYEKANASEKNGEVVVVRLVRGDRYESGHQATMKGFLGWHSRSEGK